MLTATPQTAAAIADGDRLAILVGGYDGSGNYGDIALLDAALALIDRIEPSFLVLPVIEQQFAATHEQMAAELINRPEHVLCFSPGGEPAEGLVVVEPPAGLRLAVSYLYGGGFLNPSWGERKLGMQRAVEELIANANRVVRLASGQQVDPDWIAGLGIADTAMLRRFELWGARDDASAAALAGLTAAGPAINTGDDAVSILSAPSVTEQPDQPPSSLDVNVHFAEHEWVTDRPNQVRDFNVQLLAEFSRLAEQDLRVRPLLAYLDPRIDERTGLERFAKDCAAHGIEVDEPLVMRPASIEDRLADLRGAALTISASYHVALTSLLSAIPTALLRDNDYYAQKARGLLSDFGLPDEFAPRSTDDPLAAARAIATHLLDPEARRQTRRDLKVAAAHVRERRGEAEERIQALVAGEGKATDRGPRHEITDVQRVDGELSFEVRLEGVEPKRIWLRTPLDVVPPPDAALPVAMMPAMRTGGTLTMSEQVSPRVLGMQREFQAIERAWSRNWAFGDPPLREVEVIAPTRPVESRPKTGRVAAFFSGGVDSFATVLREPDITDLIFVRGLDILPRLAHQDGLADRVEERLQAAADELGLPLITVDTNLRDLSEATGAERPLARWEAFYNSALAAVALFLEPLFDRVLISTEFPYEDQIGMGSSWMVDQLWGTENMEIADVGGLQGRVGRIEQIAGHPVAQKTLRVCWQNPDGAYNCGRCRKCMLTMASLEAIGRLEEFQTFPSELDLERLGQMSSEVQVGPQLLFCEEALEAVRLRDCVDLERALSQLVAGARQRLGLDEDRLADAEQRAAEAEAKLGEVLGSRSWRVTAPLRRLRGQG
jgi:polysaccharide pyruvyl transferase WcaK-like protein